MASYEQSRAYVLVDLILRVSHNMKKELLKKYIQKENLIGLDHFLHSNLSSILNTTLGYKRQSVFFPGFGIRTQLENWDWHMLQFVLEKLCSSLSDDIKEGLSQLNETLSILWTKCSSPEIFSNELSHSEIENYIKNIKKIFDVFLTYIESIETVQIIKEELRTAENTDRVSDPDGLMTAFQNWHLNEKELKDRLTELPPGKNKECCCNGNRLKRLPRIAIMQTWIIQCTNVCTK